MRRYELTQINVLALPHDSVAGWIFSAVLYDLGYYVHHRFAHEINFFWCGDQCLRFLFI